MATWRTISSASCHRVEDDRLTASGRMSRTSLARPKGASRWSATWRMKRIDVRATRTSALFLIHFAHETMENVEKSLNQSRIRAQAQGSRSPCHARTSHP